MPCAEAYKEHIMYTFNGYCKTVIRFAAINAWRDRSRRRQKEILRSGNHPYQRKTCRRPVSSAGEKPGNHFPLLFQALHTAGNRGNVRTLPEYDRVSNP